MKKRTFLKKENKKEKRKETINKKRKEKANRIKKKKRNENKKRFRNLVEGSQNQRTNSETENKFEKSRTYLEEWTFFEYMNKKLKSSTFSEFQKF